MDFLLMSPLLLNTSSITKYNENGVARCLGARSEVFQYLLRVLEVLKRTSKSCSFVWLCKLEHFMRKKLGFSFRNNHFASLFWTPTFRPTTLYMPLPPSGRQEAFNKNISVYLLTYPNCRVPGLLL